MSGVGVHRDLRKLAADQVELANYLYIMAKVQDGELTYVRSEKFPPKDKVKKKDVEFKFENTELVPDDEEPQDSFDRIKEILTQEQACFLIYNCYYGPGNKSGKFFLIRWVDDGTASVRTKMMYASSSNGVTAKMPALANRVVQCCDASELTYEHFRKMADTV